MASNEPARGIIAESHVRLEIHLICFIMQIILTLNYQWKERIQLMQASALQKATWNFSPQFYSAFYIPSPDTHSRQKIEGS